MPSSGPGACGISTQTGAPNRLERQVISGPAAACAELVGRYRVGADHVTVLPATDEPVAMFAILADAYDARSPLSSPTDDGCACREDERVMTATRSVHVVAAGHAHPPTVLANDALEGVVPGLQAGWLDDRLGIGTRHVLATHESLADLAVGAVRDALGSAGWDGGTVDGLICATSFVDEILPASASFISRSICPTAVAFDVNAACASFPYAVAIAESMMSGRRDLERVVVCAAERPTVWADYQDRESSIFWGDAVGCVLLEQGWSRPSFRVVEVALANDNAHPEKVRVRHHGHFHHDGRYSYQQVLDLSERTATQVLKNAGLGAGDLYAFVGHQSNVRLLAALGERLGIGWDRQWHNVEWAGNQAGAGVATAFSLGWAEHGDDLTPGDHVLLAAVGGGYSGGAILLEWVG